MFEFVPSGNPNFDVIVKIASGQPENQAGQRIGYVWATVALSVTAYYGPSLFTVGRSSEIQQIATEDVHDLDQKLCAKIRAAPQPSPTTQ